MVRALIPTCSNHLLHTCNYEGLSRNAHPDIGGFLSTSQWSRRGTTKWYAYRWLHPRKIEGESSETNALGGQESGGREADEPCLYGEMLPTCESRESAGIPGFEVPEIPE